MRPGTVIRISQTLNNNLSCDYIPIGMWVGKLSPSTYVIDDVASASLSVLEFAKNSYSCPDVCLQLIPFPSLL